MTKKRKGWWLFGGLLSAITLFAVIAFVENNRSPQARVDRFSTYVIENHGLSQKTIRPLKVTTIVYFEGDPHEAETAEAIIHLMKDSFPDWKYTTENLPVLDVEQPLDDATKNRIHTLELGDAFALEGWLIWYTPNDMGSLDPEHPKARLIIVGPSTGSLLDRIKARLPS